jgi:bisphosphoglycerate-dependent phosphoglycerate mutase
MHQQLKTYQIKINSLKEKIFLLKQFISSQNFNQNQQQVDQSSLETIQRFIQYFKNEIDQMKQKLHTVNQNE